MDSQIDLYEEQGLTERETRNKLRSDSYLNYVTGKLRLAEEKRQSLENDIVESTMSLRKASVALGFLQGREDLSTKRENNALLRAFGAKTADARLEMLNALGDQIREESKNKRVQRQLMQQELDYGDVKNAVSITKDLFSIYSSAQKLPDVDDMRWDFVEKARDKGYSRKESKMLFDIVVAPHLLE